MTVITSNYARKENDLYETEQWATEALLRVLPINRYNPVWEPAAGNHLMADVLKKNFNRVVTSDIVTYVRKHDVVKNFYDFKEPFAASIITNPPYGKANREAVKFAEHALKYCNGWIALLLTAKFDFGKSRQHLFKKNSRFWGKIALLDRISWAGNGETGTEDHAWYIWADTGISCTPRVFYEGKIPYVEAAE